MANNSDRAYFLEAVKSKPMSVADIIAQFGCSEGTARTWVRHEEIEKIPGSWPTQYIRRSSTIIPTGKTAPVREGKPGVISYEIKLPPQEQIEQFFRSVMANESPFNFTDEFRAIDSQLDAQKLLSKLKSGIVVTEYYIGLMKKEGTP